MAPSMLQRVAQTVNSVVETFFYHVGFWCARNAAILLPLMYCMAIFGVGLLDTKSTDDIYKLWVPRGSPVHDEIAFVDEYFQNSASRTEALMAEAKNRDGSDIMNRDALNAYLEVAYSIERELHIEHNGRNLYYQDVCKRFASPEIFAVQEVNLPCDKFSILDCFFEGVYGHDLAFPNFYPAKDSFNNETVNLGAVIGAGCTQYAGVLLPFNFIGGGETRDPETNAITSIATFNGLFGLASIEQLAIRLNSVTTPSDEQLDEAESILLRWENAYINMMAQYENHFDAVSFAYFAERSAGDLVSDSVNADTSLIVLGFVLMMIYAALSLSRTNRIKSRLLVGTLGVVLVIVSVVASLGLAALFGLSFDATVVQTMPFLALGLGVDDMFVLAHSYSRKPGWSVIETTANTMRTAGASITLTSVTNCISFAIAYDVVLLPSVSNFSAAASLAVVVNYFVIVVGFTALLTLDGYRQEQHRMDVFFCIKLEHESVPPPKAPRAAQRGSMYEMSKVKRIDSDEAGPASDVEGGEPRKQMRRNSSVGSIVHVHSKTGYQFGAILAKPISKVAVLVVFLGFWGFCIHGATLNEDGLPLQDIVPQSTFGAEFLRLFEDYYGSSNPKIVVGMNDNGDFEQFDFPNRISELADLMLDLEAGLTYYIEDSGLEVSAVAWPFDFQEFVALRNPDHVGPDGWVLPEFFDFYLLQFLESDATITIRGNFVFNEDDTLAATMIDFYLGGVDTTAKQVQNIRETRKVLAEYPTIPAFPTGLSYRLYEQYVGVRDQLVDGLIFVAIGVSLVSLLFLFDPRATLIMVFVIAVIITEIYGLLSYAELKINGVTVVNIIMAVGVSVEFTAHIVRSFMVAKGSRNQRMCTAMEDMTIPVINGGISTFLGISMLASASFPYFRLYFFNMYCITIFTSLFNGLFLLPVVLSLIGPPTLTLDE